MRYVNELRMQGSLPRDLSGDYRPLPAASERITEQDESETQGREGSIQHLIDLQVKQSSSKESYLNLRRS